MILCNVFGMLVCICFVCMEVCAQPMVSREVVASGGAEMTNGTHRIIRTAGQPSIGEISESEWIAGQGFWYQILSIPTDVDAIPSLPLQPVLHQNFPNPFNPSTTIEFTIQAHGHVQLTILNNSGRLIHILIDETLEAGRHLVRFKAGNLCAGVYLYRLTSGSFRAERKMLLLK